MASVGFVVSEPTTIVLRHAEQVLITSDKPDISPGAVESKADDPKDLPGSPGIVPTDPQDPPRSAAIPGQTAESVARGPAHSGAAGRAVPAVREASSCPARDLHQTGRGGLPSWTQKTHALKPRNQSRHLARTTLDVGGRLPTRRRIH